MLEKIRFLKNADWIFGRVLTFLLPSPRKRSFRHPRVLVIRPGGIGDAVHLIPTIQAIRKHYPQALIDVLAEKRNGAVFSLCQDIGRVFHYDCPQQFVAAILRHYDLVIDTEQWHRLSAIVARLTCAPVLTGFGTNERQRLFNHLADYSHDRYEVDSFFDLLSPLGITRPERVEVPFLHPSLEADAETGEILSHVSGKLFVTLFPGASIQERRWGVDRFRAVAAVMKEKGYSTVVVGGDQDRKDGEVIVSGGLGLNLAGRTTLAETAAIIDRSDLLVSGDSGILHIAVGLGKPTVSLFGPGIAEKWAPRGPDHIVINKKLPCSPCTKFGNTPRCPRNAECMSSITVEEVAEAVFTLLDRQRDKAAPGSLPAKEIA